MAPISAGGGGFEASFRFAAASSASSASCHRSPSRGWLHEVRLRVIQVERHVQADGGDAHADCAYRRCIPSSRVVHAAQNSFHCAAVNDGGWSM